MLLNFYTPEDDNIIKALYQTHSPAVIADIIKKGAWSVRNRAKKLGITIVDEKRIKKIKAYKEDFERWRQPYTAHDDMVIRLLAPTTAVIDIAILLGRTERGIINRAKRINVSLIKHGDYRYNGKTPAVPVLDKSIELKSKQKNKSELIDKVLRKSWANVA